jgi:DNA-binding response OmpR family regulator
MIVEDEAIPALELEMRLTNWGYSVIRKEARGQQAVESARALAPDLVIMDVVLADGKSGIDAADRIQTELGIPIVFLTAIEERTIDADSSGSSWIVIPKPYNPETLRIALVELLG